MCARRKVLFELELIVQGHRVHKMFEARTAFIWLIESKSQSYYCSAFILAMAGVYHVRGICFEKGPVEGFTVYFFHHLHTISKSPHSSIPSSSSCLLHSPADSLG